VAIDDKRNGIPVPPQALKSLNLRERIVNADALHTQRELSRVAVKAGADYVWTAKDNQLAMRRDIAQLFQLAAKDAMSALANRSPNPKL
jgi:predicted transposase YbfD/YdcC